MIWKVYDIEGNEVDQIEVPEGLLDVKPRIDILHQVVVWQMHNRRRFTANTRSWSDVRGGGRKPWRQKGTGRARHGSIRSPIWVGGATVHGPKPRISRMLLPKKVRKLALRMALKDRTDGDAVKVVRGMEVEKPSTRYALEVVRRFGDGKTLVVLGDGRPAKGVPSPLEKSFRNLEKVKALQVEGLNVRDILNSDQVLIDERAVERIWERLRYPVRVRHV